MTKDESEDYYELQAKLHKAEKQLEELKLASVKFLKEHKYDYRTRTNTGIQRAVRESK